MNYFKLKKKLHILFILIVSILSTTSIFAEGTKELRPTQADFGKLNPWDWGGEFASYNAPPSKRLNVRIHDHTKERIYLGFNAFYGGSTYLRIKDPNGNIVFGPYLLPKNQGDKGYIHTYDEAVAGPNKYNASGYVPINIEPSMNGDYYIELNRDLPNTKTQPPIGVRGGHIYEYFDITVADTVNNVIENGRVWANVWALTTGNGGNPFNAKLYVLREDSIRFEIDYNGIDPFGFGIISNSYGITDTGTIAQNRMSIDDQFQQGTVPYSPEHKIFLNPPDTKIWPFPKVLPSLGNINSASVDLITGCISIGYCVNITATKKGEVTVVLDLDGTPGYQAGGRDRQIISLLDAGKNCVPWDGFDGLGDTARSAAISINYRYESGFVHIPIYDAENHPAGYVFTLLSSPTQKDTLKLYWDDSNFNSNPVSNKNLTGCASLPCRNWIQSYGNERFLNTWGFAYEQNINLSNVQFEFCAPNIADDSVVVDQGQTKDFFPLLNDDPGASTFDPGSLQITCPPQNGIAVLNSPAIRYTPNPTFLGTDSICYYICNNEFPPQCDTGVIYIEVKDINLPPDGGDINGLPVVNDTSAVITLAEDSSIQLCFNWVDSDGDNITLSSLIQAPANGIATNIAGGDSCFNYTPDPDYTGNDTIAVEICDDGTPAPQCDTIYIPIFVTPVNDKPDIISGNGIPEISDTITVITLNEDTPTQVCLSLTDIDGDNLDVSQVLLNPQHGSINSIGTGDSCFTYNPAPDYNGPDIIQVLACDNGSPVLCDSVWIEFDVLPVNDKPIAKNDTLFLDPGMTGAKFVMINDSDLETKVNLSITIVGNPTKGTAVKVGDSIRYTPFPSFTLGLDTVIYAVCDTGAPVLCDTAILLISVPLSDFPPVANDDFSSTPEDVPVLINVLNNDFDPNLDPVSVTVLTPPQNGMVTLQGNQLLYTPDSQFSGKDSLSYTACDTTMPVPLCDMAWVFIDVIPMPDNPVIIDSLGNPVSKLNYVINEDTPTQFCLDATDADAGQTLDVTQWIAASGNGTVSGLGNNDTCFTYTPDLNYNGVDSLQIVVCDNASPAGCDTVWVQIDILPVNDPPVAVNDFYTVDEDITSTLLPLPNDSDLYDQSPLDISSLQIIGGPYNGNAIVVGTDIAYTPNPGFNGTDSIRYIICDTGVPLPSLCDTAVIFITVDFINDPPVAVNDTVGARDGIPQLIDVLNNDFDPDNDPLQITVITPPQNGVANDTNGGISYTANLGYCGSDSLQYVICDTAAIVQCDTAWVFISVEPSDDDQDSLSNNYETLTRNTDGDVLNDYLDIDSDNDGITDLIESIPIGDICNPVAFDFDQDNVPDYRDLDSDNDGIPDWAERSIDIVSPTGLDTDGDGIDDAYDADNGGYLEDKPIDFDNDGSPDFRDIDTDGDGIPDWLEGTDILVAPTGIDTDGDGIDDAWDTDNGGVGLYANPEDTDKDGIPDFRDLDSDGDRLPDIMEAGGDGKNPVDTDGDGIPDFRDIDSDNDGIDDENEGNDQDDCDGDGIPDRLDPDVCDVVIPQGISPNGDGSNDAFVIEGLLDRYPNNTLEVYNRWGYLVYSKKPYDNSWQGESNKDAAFGEGKSLPAGTYFYVLDLGNGTSPKTGYLLLKR